MKKHFIFAAIIITAMTVFFTVSCKKDKDQAPETFQNKMSATAIPSMSEDMDGYLSDFKQHLKQQERGEEQMGIGDAAWHLAALANYDYGYFNAEHTSLLIDTLYSHVTVTGGNIFLSDLATAYENISQAIESYYDKLNLENKHFHFIDVDVTDDGDVTVTLIVTYSDRYHWWYPSDSTYCNDYIYGQGPFWNFGNGMELLEDLLNLIESCTTDTTQMSYAVPYRNVVLWPEENIDPYGSPNFWNSRIYCTNGKHNDTIPETDMCYYLQSYHALGHGLLPPTGSTSDVIAYWKITEDIWCTTHSMNSLCVYYHKVDVHIGTLHVHNGGEPGHD